MDRGETASRYARDVDLSDLDNAHTLGILLTPPGTTVLDIGVADGHPVAEGLVQQGCRVFGVEVDETAAESARAVCEQVVVGDVEALDLRETFPGLVPDVVLLLDVLEHLVDPVTTLRRAAELLPPHGKVVVSIPNVTHAAVTLQLMGGAFTYTDTGILDRTHLRFFDAAGMEQLFREAGLPVHESLRVRKPLTGTEIPVDPSRHTAEAVAAALAHPEAETFQFVVVAGAPGSPEVHRADGTLLERLQAEVRRAVGTIAEGSAYAAGLESTLADKERYIGELEGLAHELRLGRMTLEQELAERMAELTTLHEQLVALRSDVQVKDAYIADLLVAPPTDPDIVNRVGYAAVDKTVGTLRRAPAPYRAVRGATRLAAKAARVRAARRGR